ncbi:MAG TPA: sulfite exporter TauE/SafE family protein [bacterium]|nr:sulfite exporter TauE/SafE family protein [bacterium]
MVEAIQSFDLHLVEWLLVLLCGVFVGLAKTGIAGLGMLVVAVLAAIFGGKLSTGILLPMLCVGDLFAVKYYNRHAEWKFVWKLMPWALTGVLTGVLVGHLVSDSVFKTIMGVIILFCIALMIWQDTRSAGIYVPDYWWFAALMGLLGGFATMMGNAAGPIMAIYLLSMRLPKNNYIGTTAWFFLIVNYLKIPFHVLVWNTITLRSLALDLTILPAIGLGAMFGVRAVRHIPERTYRIFIMSITLFAGIILFF